jgi:hypothetical protein
MSRLLLIAAVLLVVACCPVAGQIPAFPGAQGYGSHANGGRGGDVYTVTTLEPTGPGSFTDAIQTVPPAGRTIVFAVSGWIPINKLRLTSPNVTIAGQTAPGDGVGISGSSFLLSADHLVIRHLRMRHGRDGNGGDCLNVDDRCANLILDHCDVMFSTDENFSGFRKAPPRMTLSWSINAWGLANHSAGGLWLVDHATAHHNLWAHNHTRNPKVIQPAAFQWVNNIIFGFTNGMNLSGMEIPGTYRTSVIGSWFIHGASGSAALYGGGPADDGSIPLHLHISDTAFDNSDNQKLDVTRLDFDVYNGKPFNRSNVPFPQTESADPAKPTEPIVGQRLLIDDRDTAYKKILSQVGPLRLDVAQERPLHDAAIALLIDDVRTMRRRIIANEKELNLPGNPLGQLELGTATAPSDRDGDGMPDDWETALGSDPDAANHNDPLPAQGGQITGPTFMPPGTPAGYTRLEEYLHFKAIPHGWVGKSLPSSPTHLRIDLRKFTSGFTDSPTFRIRRIFGGNVQIIPKEPGVVIFRPAPGHVGRAGFDFTVTDRSGSQWTQSCGIVVVPSAQRPDVDSKISKD